MSARLSVGAIRPDTGNRHPLAVAHFPGESAATFDMVVFDEASQILLADAIRHATPIAMAHAHRGEQRELACARCGRMLWGAVAVRRR
jgi:hypothetical protein